MTNRVLPGRLETIHSCGEESFQPATEECDVEEPSAAAGREAPLHGTRSESLRRWQALAAELDDMCSHSVASVLSSHAIAD